MKYHAVIHARRKSKVNFTAASLDAAKQIAIKWAKCYADRFDPQGQWYKAESGPEQHCIMQGNVLLSLFVG